MQGEALIAMLEEIDRRERERALVLRPRDWMFPSVLSALGPMPRQERPTRNDAVGRVLFGMPRLLPPAPPKPLTKRQRRRLRGKAHP